MGKGQGEEEGLAGHMRRIVTRSDRKRNPGSPSSRRPSRLKPIRFIELFQRRGGNRESGKATIQANQQMWKDPDGRFAQPLKTREVDIDFRRERPLIV
jgi:hypothetical protein